jgi:hypothetical protein
VGLGSVFHTAKGAYCARGWLTAKGAVVKYNGLFCLQQRPESGEKSLEELLFTAG